ncbi:MAG: hypothetical protein IH892_20565 [Planctomycetes bacterium]|nr:hypothetical protein [Planctomycetota bacterium]
MIDFEVFLPEFKALSENSGVGPRASHFFFGCFRLLAPPRFGQRKPLFSPGKTAKQAMFFYRRWSRMQPGGTTAAAFIRQWLR